MCVCVCVCAEVGAAGIKVLFLHSVCPHSVVCICVCAGGGEKEGLQEDREDRVIINDWSRTYIRS